MSNIIDDEGLLILNHQYVEKDKFMNDDNKNKLKKLIITNKVTTIYPSTFISCDSLNEIIINDRQNNASLSIYDSAFQECNSLKSIIITDNYNINIHNNAFVFCYNIIPKKYLEINQQDLNNLTNSWFLFNKYKIIKQSVEEVNLNVLDYTSIKNYTFAYYASLKKINIPDSVEYIGDNAFRYCRTLENIEIPVAVTSMGVSVFAFCSSLKNITLPASIDTINNNTFEGCQSLENINFSSVNTIGDYSFKNCKKLKSIKITSVTSIGNNAFEGCSNLIDVVIDNPVGLILNENIFNNCYDLKTIRFKNEYGESLNLNNLFSSEIKVNILYDDTNEAVKSSWENVLEKFKNSKQFDILSETKYDKLINSIKLFPILSNLSYICIIISASIRYFVKKNIDIDGYVILCIIVVITIIFSSLYHECDNNLRLFNKDIKYRDDKIYKKKIGAEITTYYKDNYGDDNPTTGFQLEQNCYIGKYKTLYSLLKYKDHILANISIVFIVLIVTNINKKLRYILLIMSFVFLLSVLSYKDLEKYYLQYIPIGLSILLFMFYIVYLFRNYNSKLKNNMLQFILCYVGGVILFCVAFIFFKQQNDYWLYHSLWHIFGSIAGSLILYPKFLTKKQQNVIKKKTKVF